MENFSIKYYITLQSAKYRYGLEQPESIIKTKVPEAEENEAKLKAKKT